MARYRTALVVLTATLAGACGGAPGERPKDDAGAGLDGGAGSGGADAGDAAPEVAHTDSDAGPPIVGSVDVFYLDDALEQRGMVAARFRATGLPSWYHEVAAAGSCRVLRFTQGFCEPECPGVCAGDGTCHPRDERFDPIGPLSVEGLARAVSIDPNDHAEYIQVGLPFPLFAADANVVVRAMAPSIGTLALASAGVPRLVALDIARDGTSTYAVDARTGADLTFRWTPSADPSLRVRAVLNSYNRGHGLPLLTIVDCDGPDTGTLTVPGSLLAMFPRTVEARSCVQIDCPLSVLMRYRRAEARAPGGVVELTVASQVQFFLRKE